MKGKAVTQRDRPKENDREADRETDKDTLHRGPESHDKVCSKDDKRCFENSQLKTGGNSGTF